MGLFESATSTVLTTYKADTADHEKSVKKLRGEQKKLAQEQLDSLNKQNDRIDKQIALVGKLAVGIGGAAVAFETLRRNVKVYAEDAQMQFAAQKFDIDRLREVTRGLIDDQQLLAFAAAAANGGFEVSQRQLEMTGKAMLSLRKQGNELNAVIEKTTQAIVEGNTGALAEFGVLIDASSETAEGFQAIMAKLGVEAEKFGGQFDIAGDSAQRMEVRFSNAMRDIQIALGKLAESMVPILEGIVAMVKKLSDAADAIPGWLKDGVRGVGMPNPFGGLSGDKLRSLQSRSLQGAIASAQSNVRGQQAFARGEVLGIGGERGKRIKAGFEKLMSEGRTVEALELLARARLFGEGRPVATPELDFDPVRVGGGRGGGGRGGPTGVEVMYEDPQFAEIMARSFGGSDSGAGAVKNRARAPITPAQAAQETAAALEAVEATMTRLQLGQNETLLKKIFGTAEEIDGITTALGAVRDMSTAAFSAWIDGSKSMKEAVKAAFQNALKGLALEMFSRALYHGAAAIGALAIGGPIAGASAAAHGKAAGLYSAGAIATGAFARQLGGGSTGAGAGAGVSSAVGGRVGGAGGQRRISQTFFLGDSWIEESPRRRAAKINQALTRTTRARGGSSGEVVEFS